jgi:hypothetical protein
LPEPFFEFAWKLHRVLRFSAVKERRRNLFYNILYSIIRGLSRLDAEIRAASLRAADSLCTMPKNGYEILFISLIFGRIMRLL